MKSFIKNFAQSLGYNLKKINKRHYDRNFPHSRFKPQTELVPTSLEPSNELSKYFLGNKSNDITNKYHHYFDIYNRYFSNSNDITFLEIGVAKGGSLKMWGHFFGTKAKIIGIDIAEDARSFEGENTYIRIGDQADPTFLKSLADEFGPFDIILDDGGHTAAQQTNSLLYLYPHVKVDGGIYMVEDTHTSFWGYTDTQDGKSFLDFCSELPSYLHEPYYQGPDKRITKVSPFCASTYSISFYDSIVVFEKRKKSLPTWETR